MNPGTFTGKSAMPIIMTMFLLILASTTITITNAQVTELNVTPEVVVQGEMVSISGKASPDKEVWIGSSFAISLHDVPDGNYSREFIGIYFPKGEKEFSVTAEKVKNIRLSLEVGEDTIKYPPEGPLNATNGTATISVPFPIPTQFGPIDISVYGDAADDATSVNLDVAMWIKVTTDLNGDFSLDINTGGVPIGEFWITAGEIEKKVEVVSTATPTPMPTPTPSSNGGDGSSGDGDGGSGSDAPETTPTPTPTTPENVTSNETTPTPTPTLIPTSTPVSTTTAPQTTPIKTETGDKTPGPTPQNETNQTPQETTEPSGIPGFGFEAIGCIAIAALIMIIMKKRKSGAE